MAFIAGILGITLTELGKQVGLFIVGAAATKTFNMITSSSGTATPSQELQANVNEALNRLTSIRSEIAKMSGQIANQIAHLQVSLKTDKLRDYVTSIEALDEMYWKATVALSEASKLEAGDAKMEQLRKCQQRNQELGQRVSNEIYPALVHVHVYLTKQGTDSFLNLVSQQSLKDNDDLYVHYCTFRAVLVYYYLVQSRAINLFETVVADPNVNFTEGQKLISEVNNRISKQESLFYSLFPKRIADVCMKLSLSPDQPLAINWASVKAGGANKAGVYVQAVNIGYIRDRPQSRSEPYRWILRPHDKLIGPNDSSDKSVTNEYYIYRPLDSDPKWQPKYNDVDKSPKYMVAMASPRSQLWEPVMFQDDSKMGGNAKQSGRWTLKMTTDGHKILFGFMSWLNKFLYLADDGSPLDVISADKGNERIYFDIRL